MLLPRPNETIIEDDRKQSGNVAFMDTLTGPVYHSLCVCVCMCKFVFAAIIWSCWAKDR